MATLNAIPCKKIIYVNTKYKKKKRWIRIIWPDLDPGSKKNRDELLYKSTKIIII